MITVGDLILELEKHDKKLPVKLFAYEECSLLNVEEWDYTKEIDEPAHVLLNGDIKEV